jgi:hypothetical protein
VRNVRSDGRGLRLDGVDDTFDERIGSRVRGRAIVKADFLYPDAEPLLRAA